MNDSRSAASWGILIKAPELDSPRALDAFFPGYAEWLSPKTEVRVGMICARCPQMLAQPLEPARIVTSAHSSLTHHVLAGNPGPEFTANSG